MKPRLDEIDEAMKAGLELTYAFFSFMSKASFYSSDACDLAAEYIEAQITDNPNDADANEVSRSVAKFLRSEWRTL